MAMEPPAAPALLLMSVVVLVAAAARYDVPAVIVFGDSIVDPGNNNRIKTAAKANFPPYGRDFPGGVATGRFSNGRVPGDIIASLLGVKQLLPAYVGVDLPPEELLTGVCFASGASGYDPLTSQTANVFSLDQQLAFFKEYTGKLAAIAGEEAAANIVDRSVYITCTGTNDLNNLYFLTPLRRFDYDLPTYVDMLVSWAINFLRELQQLGARKVGFVGLPPIGCVPSQRAPVTRQCEPVRNQAAALFNSRVQQAIERLDDELRPSGARVIYLDIYYNLLDLIHNPFSYGFDVTTEGCCGSQLLEAAVFVAGRTCAPNSSEFVFWDAFHPTEKAYTIIVDRLFNGNLANLF